MADDFKLKWDGAAQELYGEDPSTGNRVTVPTEELAVSASLTDASGTAHTGELADASDVVTSNSHVGRLTITGTGTQSVTGVGFQPSTVKLEIHSNGGQNVNTAGGGGSTVSNSASQMTGFARADGTRQAIGNAASGASINEVRRFSTNNKAILMVYAGQNGGVQGTLDGDVSSFDSDGFTVDINSVPQNEVVIYTAFR